MFNSINIHLIILSLLLLLGAPHVVKSTDYQQQAFLKASNPDVLDRFAYGAVAISGDTLVIGSRFEGSDATDVNGDESNNNAVDAGAVYVFTRTAGVWNQQAYLKASNTDASDFFGYSVAISGNTIIVGAPQEDSSATGIDGDESNNNAALSGAAYVFTRSAGAWSQQAYLKASNTESGDNFGSVVAISENKAVISAPLEDSNATGVNGDENNNTSFMSGAAYVFSHNAGIWSQEAYLKASNTDAFDKFGIDVAISNNLIVVGAYSEGSDSTGINGDENNNDASGSGAAYVFHYSPGSWHQEAYLKASNTGASDSFGIAVDISDNTIVVGANLEDSDSSGVNGDESNDDAEGSGAVYVFTRFLGFWIQQAYIKASNPDIDDWFGKSVAISGRTILIGAYHEDSNTSGIDGDENNNDSIDSGAAYVFTRTDSIWSQQHYLKSEFPEDIYYFGAKVNIDGNTLLVSEQGEGFIVTGSGAAYVFHQPNSYGLNVAVTGLMSGGLVLQNNGTDDLSILNNGMSQFATPLPGGGNYLVTVSNQPDNTDHTCIIDSNSQGVIAAANVLIKVRCADFIFVDDFE